MELKGKTAIITGSSGFLGSNIAIALGRAGCNCVCHYNKNKQKAEFAAGQIMNTGAKAITVQADLTDENQIEKLFEQANKIGTPQILINSAAVFSRQPVSEINGELAQKIMNINLITPILTSRIFAEKLLDGLLFEPRATPARRSFSEGGSRESRAVVGKIINIADVCGLRPWANYVLYCSSKAALIAATKALAKELAPAICVNAVAPGIVSWPENFDKEKKGMQLVMIPLKRIAKPEEVAAAILSLLENDYITGQVLCIDGGKSI